MSRLSPCFAATAMLNAGHRAYVGACRRSHETPDAGEVLARRSHRSSGTFIERPQHKCRGFHACFLFLWGDLIPAENRCRIARVRYPHTAPFLSSVRHHTSISCVGRTFLLRLLVVSTHRRVGRTRGCGCRVLSPYVRCRIPGGRGGCLAVSLVWRGDGGWPMNTRDNDRRPFRLLRPFSFEPRIINRFQVRGGGQCSLRNYRTLCVPCHAAATKRLAGERAAARAQRTVDGDRSPAESPTPAAGRVKKKRVRSRQVDQESSCSRKGGGDCSRISLADALSREELTS